MLGLESYSLKALIRILEIIVLLYLSTNLLRVSIIDNNLIYTREYIYISALLRGILRI